MSDTHSSPNARWNTASFQTVVLLSETFLPSCLQVSVEAVSDSCNLVGRYLKERCCLVCVWLCVCVCTRVCACVCAPVHVSVCVYVCGRQAVWHIPSSHTWWSRRCEEDTENVTVEGYGVKSSCGPAWSGEAAVLASSHGTPGWIRKPPAWRELIDSQTNALCSARVQVDTSLSLIATRPFMWTPKTFMSMS